MEKQTTLVALLMVIVLMVGGGALLYSQQQPGQRVTEQRTPTPTQQVLSSTVGQNPLASRSAAVTSTPTIGAPTANLTLITVGVATPVTVTVHITDTRFVPNSATLLLLGAAGTQPTILGHLQSNGSGTYSIQTTLTGQTTGQIQLQVSAAFPGQLKRIMSQVLTIPVWGVVTNATAGFMVLYPPSLYNLTNLSTESSEPNLVDLESSPTGVAIGSTPDSGSAVSASGFRILVSVDPYNVPSFDINQYLSTMYQDLAGDASITPITIGGQPGYEYTFDGEEGGEWPRVVVYRQGYVYKISYSDTDYIPGFSSQDGLNAFNDVLQRFTFNQ